MIDVASKIAAAAGDAAALQALAIELAMENAKLAERAAVLDERRSRDAARKRGVRGLPQTSEEERGHARSGADSAGPLPPSPSLLSPTPPNNPSSPPIPASPSAREDDASGVTESERELFAEVDSPAFVGAVGRFLAGKSETARTAWIGRFRGAMGRPPHPTPQELADALGDLMTEPAEKWVPALFRTYVGRIRRDAAREAERDAAPLRVRPAMGAAIGAVPTLVAEAAVLWSRYKAAGLLTRTGPEVLRTRGEQLVADGHYPDYAAFHAEIAVTKPWELADARNDGWAINQLAARLAGPRQAAS